MLEYNLMENSIDSLNEAMNYYIKSKEEEENRLFKYAILLLNHSIELILKEILEREHSSLIYKDIDDSDSIETVSIYQALNRIKNVCEIDFPEHFKSRIIDLARERNKIQHYKVNIEKGLAVKLLNNGYAIFKYFLSDVLNEKLNDYKNLISDDMVCELESLEDTYKSLKKLATEVISGRSYEYLYFKYYDDKKLKLPCPKCSEKYIAKDDNGNYKCYFCYTEFDSKENIFMYDENSYISEYMINEIINKRKQKYKFPVMECPNCKADTLVYFDTKQNYLCLTCFEKYEVKVCNECDEYYPDSEMYFVVGAEFIQQYGEEWDYKEVCHNCANKDKYEISFSY